MRAAYANASHHAVSAQLNPWIAAIHWVLEHCAWRFAEAALPEKPSRRDAYAQFRANQWTDSL
jgi:hypothetical protein